MENIKPLPYPHSSYHYVYIMLRNLLKKNNPTIVEIGSNNGGDAIRFLHYFPSCKLYCFEADPRAIEVFKNNVPNKNCKLYEYIVSDICDDKDFNQIYITDIPQSVPGKHSWMSKTDYNKYAGTANSSTSNVELRHNEYIKKVKVKSITLNEWDKNEQIELVDFLEIDVQGGEKKVLDGAKEFLNKVKYIKIEYGETRYVNAMTRIQTIKYLNKYGFKVIEPLSSTGNSGDLFFIKS